MYTGSNEATIVILRDHFGYSEAQQFDALVRLLNADSSPEEELATAAANS